MERFKNSVAYIVILASLSGLGYFFGQCPECLVLFIAPAVIASVIVAIAWSVNRIFFNS